MNKTVEVQVDSRLILKPKISHRVASKAIADLYTKMLEGAGIAGSFAVRLEKFTVGAETKNNTIRFQCVPIGSTGGFMLKVNHQLEGADTSVDGSLAILQGEKEWAVHEQLKAAYPRGVFDATAAAHAGSPEHALTDKPKLRRFLRGVCDMAAKDPDALVLLASVDTLAAEIYPKVKSFQPRGVVSYLRDLGYADFYDSAADCSYAKRRVLVEKAAFDFVGREHPEDRQPAPEKAPVVAPKPAQAAPAPQPTTASPAPQPSPMTPLSLLQQLQRAKAVVAEVNGTEVELEKMRREESNIARELGALRRQLAELQLALDEKAAKLKAHSQQIADLERSINDPAYLEAKTLLDTLRELVK